MGFSSIIGASSVIRPGVCTSTTRPSSPYDGQVIYETDTDRLLSYDGSVWVAYVKQTAGKVLQVVSTTKTDTFSTTSTSLTDVTGLSVSITPTASSSTFLITGNVCWSQDLASPAYLAAFLIDRNGTSIGIAAADGSRGRFTFGSQGIWVTDATLFSGINFLDSPATTSTLTYKVRCQAESPRTIWVNRGSEPDGNSAITGRFISTITVMEVAG